MPRSITIAFALAACLAAGGAARAEPPERVVSVLRELEPDGVRAPPDLRGGQPITVYLNMEGGIYSPGEPNDSRANVTSVADLPAAIPPWDASDEEKAALVECVAEMFGPFGLVITDEDPGDVSHLEAVVGGDPSQIGEDVNTGGISPFLTNCGVIQDSIVFAFPSVMRDPRRLCETIAQEVAHSFGLDHEYLCGDPMTYLTGCGDKRFLFEEARCGETGPRPCKCSRTQNSAQLLLERIGRGAVPGVWMNEPASGDLVAAGFPVQAVVTHAPASLDLMVDGVLVESVAPEETGEPYQIIEFGTNDFMRSGTHEIELVARYGGEAEHSIVAVVEVEGGPGDEVVSEGCSAGEGRGGAMGGALVAALLLGLARRTRPGGVRRRSPPFAPLVGLVAALAACASACSTSVFGLPTDEIESGCPVEGDASPAIGVLWTPEAGTCTATLVGPYSLVTAAHCVADASANGDPIVFVAGGRQSIAAAALVHPGWSPGAPIDDVAALVLGRPVEGIEPMPLGQSEPVAGDEFTLIGHGAWSPDEVREAERQAASGSIAEVQERSFSYDDTDEAPDQACLEGRGGGPVLAPSGELLGLHGEDRRVMRVDHYACWLSCGTSTAGLPGAADDCDCSRADWRPCGECGAEFLDASFQLWSECEPAEALRPCADGQTCDPTGECV